MLYFVGELLFRTFTIPLSLVRVGVVLLGIIFAPAAPPRMLVRMSPTAALSVACLGWGVLAELARATVQRLRRGG